MKNKTILITIVFLMSCALWADSTGMQVPPGRLLFPLPIIPLLIESLIIAGGGKIKKLEFFQTLAFWYLITSITYIPFSFVLENFEGGSDSLVYLFSMVGLLILIETPILIYWMKYKLKKRLIFYPLLLVIIGNIAAFLLGTIIK